MPGDDSQHDEIGPWDIPVSWKWIRIGDMCEVVGGGTPPTADPSNYEGGNIPWITPADLSNHKGVYISSGARCITEKGFHSSSARLLPKGSVLLSSRAPIGYVSVAANEVATNQGFKSFILPDGILSEYLYYYLLRAKPLLMNMASGTTFKELSGSRAGRVPLPLAPLEQQRRIVDKIRETFDFLDRGVEFLNRAAVLLARYRSSILNAAVSGKLTEKWRAENTNVESASILLERILEERRRKWEEQQLGKYERAGQVPPEGWREKYREPVRARTAGLPDVPDGWCWATVAQLGAPGEQTVLTGPFGTDLGRDDFTEDGVPLLTIGCLLESGLDLHNARHVSNHKADELLRYRARLGDVLFSRQASVGRAAVITKDSEGSVINYHLMRLRLATACMNPWYFLAYVKGSQIVRNYLREVNHGATRDGINTAELLGLPVAVPPIDEQMTIANQVDIHLSIVVALSDVLETANQRAEHLRNAILSQAFRGCLA